MLMPDTRSQKQIEEGNLLMHAYWNSNTYIINSNFRVWIGWDGIGCSIWFRNRMILYKRIKI